MDLMTSSLVMSKGDVEGFLLLFLYGFKERFEDLQIESGNGHELFHSTGNHMIPKELSFLLLATCYCFSFFWSLLLPASSSSFLFLLPSSFLLFFLLCELSENFRSFWSDFSSLWKTRIGTRIKGHFVAAIEHQVAKRLCKLCAVESNTRNVRSRLNSKKR